MPCEIRASGERHKGIVLNLSAGGLFVQTNASLRTGEWIELELPLETRPEPLAMRAAVVWRKLAPRAQRGATKGGVGVELVSVPGDYRSFVDSILARQSDPQPSAGDLEGSAAAAAPDAAAAPLLQAWRVRVRLDGSPRTRSVDLRAGSEADAIERAAHEAGRGWQAVEAHSLVDFGEPD